MEIVLRIDKVGGTFRHRPREERRDIAYIERRARRCGFYGEDWKLERVTGRELVFVRGNERSVVQYEIIET